MYLEMIRKCQKYIELGIGHVLVVLGAHVRVLVPNNDGHFNAYCA